MSLNKLISIHDAIYNTFGDTGLDIKTETPWLMRLAVEAEKKIGSYYGWKKQIAVLTGDKCRVKLPIECMSIQRMVIGDYGCSCDTLITNSSNWSIQNLNVGAFISENPGVFSLQVDLDPQGNNFNLYDNKYEIQNNHMVFSRSVDKQKVTILYLGYEVDCDGFLLVNENHILAITAYIKWHIAKRSRYTPDKMDIADIKMNESEWIDLRNLARGEDAELQPHDQRAIAAMLHDPWSGWGVPLYNDNFLTPYVNFFN